MSPDLTGCAQATGNIATEDLAYLLRGEGIDPRLDVPGLLDDAEWLSQQLDSPVQALLGRAGDFPLSPKFL